MAYEDHAAFFRDTPSYFGEKLPIDRKTCLIIGRISGCTCGTCGEKVPLMDRPTQCSNDICQQEWKYLIVTPGAPEIADPWLPIMSESAILRAGESTRDLESRSRSYRQRMGSVTLENIVDT